MKLAIIGSRKVENLDISAHVGTMPDEIVSGGARGVDTLAALYAKENGIALTEFYPDYKSFGRGAPLRRNEQICQYADAVLAFWDGESRGTKYTIDYARKLGKPVRIINI